MDIHVRDCLIVFASSFWSKHKKLLLKPIFVNCDHKTLSILKQHDGEFAVDLR